MSLTVLSFFEEAERIGERHFAVLVMVSVGLAVGGEVDQLRRGGVFETALEASDEVVAGVEQALEGDGSGSFRCRRRSRIPGVTASFVTTTFPLKSAPFVVPVSRRSAFAVELTPGG